MNVFTNHIYNFLNLHFLRACQQLSEDKPYDESLVDCIPVINEQFIRYISHSLYGYSEARSKYKSKEGKAKREAKIKSLKTKIDNWIGKKAKKYDKLIKELGKQEMINTDFFLEFPEKLRKSLDATKKIYVAGLGVCNGNLGIINLN